MKHLYFASLLLCLVGCSKKDDAKSTCCTGPGPQIVSPHPNLQFTVPNVITPNGDNRNDLFFPFAVDKNSTAIPKPLVTFASQSLKVFRLSGGSPVFISTSPQNRFGGRDDSGADLSEGSYRYELQLDDNTITGNLCIVRQQKNCDCIPIDLGDQLLENCR
ncbi:gliding motility-associated C-terminal domain-containing protein [Hymenobacter sp. BT523]|uniref:T9SS type B sorting domain-containing protein n=1 Tax=Hymenobacter sp. BT523 TaxID=2795725 RepID=UPI0018EB2ABB|nr:gliding motility-associated C-terminal domain-containing protein [Hymenobacter sp. BT523]MBJ6109470.1 gliding motility-associated C-terminal domain-containing protein [Hymenobacter sp. BT523]